MILLWLLPPVLVTVVAMLWVTWLGREGRGEVDRDEAVRRLGAALEGRSDGWRPRVRRRAQPGYAVAPRPRDRSSGVAVRRPAPDTSPGTPPGSSQDAPGGTAPTG